MVIKLMVWLLFIAIGVSQARPVFAQPANDNFANAELINGANGTVTGTNLGATVETSEPLETEGYPYEFRSTVWYRYTPTATGILTVETTGSNFDTALSIYTGTVIYDLTQLATNNDNNSTPQSQISLQVTQGIPYSIQVGGMGDEIGDTGTIKLKWSQPAQPANDNFANAELINGANGTVTGTNLGATVETSEPLETEGYPYEFRSTIWYRYTPTATGILTLDTMGSNFDTALSIYTGAVVYDLTKLKTNNDANGTSQSQFSIQVTAGVPCSIQVGGMGDEIGDTGIIKLNWSQAPAPSNDNFANAQLINGTHGTLTGSNSGATVETSEPLETEGYPYEFRSTIWYRYTPTATGILTLDTMGSNFDTSLSIYTGTVVYDLTQLVTNNDAYDTPQSAVSLQVTAGITYSIQIGGMGDEVGDMGRFTLNWSGPGTPGYSISGRVTTLNSQGFPIGVPGVAINQSGGGAVAVTDLDGSYFYTGLPNATYELTPTHVSYGFSPDSRSVVVSDAKAVNQDFIATPLSLSINDIGIVEGNSGSATAVFTVTLSQAASVPVAVEYAMISTGTYPATTDTDYSPLPPGHLDFAVGETSKTVTVEIKGDTLDEENETVGLVLNTPTNAIILDALGILTITDDDASPALRINNVTTLEGNSGSTNATFTVSLSAASARTITVQYSTANNTATAGNDYKAQALTTLTFAPGTTTKTLSVPVFGDVLDETNETYFVNLTNASKAQIVDNQGLGVITDDDASPNLSVSAPTVIEGNSGTINLTYTVRLSAISGQQVTVRYATTTTGTYPATAGVDYTALPWTVLTFAPGEMTKTVTVAVKGDALDEYDENVGLSLGTPTNATLTEILGIGTITDNDATPTLSINDFTGPEGNSGTTNAAFTVKLSAPSGRLVSVKYKTSNGTATAATDYTARTLTTLTFAPGTTTKTLTVPLVGDLLDESDETYSVALSAPTNAAITDFQGIGTLKDDDTSRISVKDTFRAEGNSGTVNLTYNISLSNPSTSVVTVKYITSSSGTYPATVGIDYVGKPLTTVSFAPGETSKTVSVVVNGDILDENNETVGLTLSAPVNAAIADSQAIGTITDDDASPALRINNVTTLEGNSGSTNATFTVSLSAASARTITVQYSTANNTATAGNDYKAQALTTLTFAPGTTTKTLSVPIFGDVLDETNEVYTVGLSNAVGATIIAKTGTGIVTDDDTSQITVNDPFVVEGNSGLASLIYTISLSTPNASTVTVRYNTSNTTSFPATAGMDYISHPFTTLTFAPGETSKTVPVTIIADVLDEDNETLALNLSAPSKAVLADNAGVGTITDNDTPPSIVIEDVTLTEGDGGSANATLKVALSGPSGRTVTVRYATADVSATAGNDYTAIPLSTLTFTGGQSMKTIVVPVLGDQLNEGQETFKAILSGATNATIADNTGLGTIVDNDPLPELSIDNASLAEGNSGTSLLTFTLSLSKPSGKAVTVKYATVNTGTTGATAGEDYTAIATTTINFAPGEVSKSVSVIVKGDTKSEADETLGLALSAPVNATITTNQGIGIINNDDVSGTSTVRVPSGGRS